VIEGQGFHAFDDEKILLDPYARAVYFPDSFDREAARRPGPNDGEAPLGVIDPDREFDWEDDSFVQHGHDLVIYEMHVRGFTKHPSSGVSKAKRGTYTGVIEKIPHLVDLGITAVELMPVYQFDPQEGNYWGYMPLNFFSPHRDYAASAKSHHQRNEFRQMVKEFHRAGIEVILDVVYNHTCEGDQQGPNYSYRGIDNDFYYTPSGHPHFPYANLSGCGNTLDASSVAVRKLIVDSLRYWREEMHIDGFRFDLASIFAMNSDGRLDTEHPPIFGQISSIKGLRGARLIAEPWDAAGTYQLGRSFPGWLWMQWNAKYRDTVQRFVRGDHNLVPKLMTRLYGSSDLFPDDQYHSCRPWQSVNYVTSHDGSTLYDLVSYEKKNNWANGHDNTDGCHEYSWNCGWEGDEEVPEKVARLRKQQVKNFFCLMMLSNGVPMFRMGDEFLQTQGGNNNAYNQDNETSWLDWQRLKEHADMFRFVKEMIAFRKAHRSISRSFFWRDDVRWYGTRRPVDMSAASRTLAFYLDGKSAGADDLYVMINAHNEPLEFGIHEGSVGQWRLAIDTSWPSPKDIVPADARRVVNMSTYEVQRNSVVVLVREQG
jgi:glycogen operon protein